ncbi:MAG: hypothetical protein GTO24_02520 [candidate division Zixibacteria bacterium]|nr:hypothetical protein [candidate division Zixibacteria bacterium]
MIRGARITPDGTLLDPAGINISAHSRGQSAPSCASRGDTYWVSFHTNACDSTYSNIYTVRVNANGLVLDPDGLPICTAGADQREAEIASAGNHLLVVWEDQRDYESSAYDVYGARLSPDGTVLDPDGISIAQLGLSERAPQVCWSGDTFMAVWERGDYQVHGDVVGVRIDTLGQVSDPTPLTISIACQAQIFGSCAWSGNSYLAIWEEGGNLRSSRFNQFGDVLDSVITDVCSASEDQNEPDLVWGEENFFAVWEDSRNLDFDIYGARIDSVGEVLDSSSLPINIDPTTDQRYPVVAFDGTNYLVVWQNMLDPTGSNYRIEGLRVSQAGEPLDLQPFAISSGEKGANPDVAFGGGKYLVVWQDVYFYDIYGALVDTNPPVKSQFGIRTASGLQEDAAVASNGSDFLVVWEDFGMHWPNADILATRVTSGGAVLDPGGIPVSTASDPDLVPSVTFDGTNYVVAWRRSAQGSSELYVSRVTPQGAVLDPDGIPISDMSSYSDVVISFGPLSSDLSHPKGQSLMLYSKYMGEPYNSHRMFGALFWGGPEPNLPPEPFSLLLPADGDTVMKPVFLDWQDAYDPNAADQVTYTVYLSPSEQFPPDSTLLLDSLSASECHVSPEEDSLVYWWMVEAKDSWGQSRWSNQIWSFDLESYGDVNGDGKIDPGDVVFLLNYLFRGGSAPRPLAAGDTNGDCEVNAGDVVYLISYLFKGGPGPQAGCA